MIVVQQSQEVQTVQTLSTKGPVTEKLVADMRQTSYVTEVETSQNVKNVLNANVLVFNDDHDKDLTIGSEHIEKILKSIHNELKAVYERTNFDIMVSLSLHALGIVKEDVVKSAHKKYSQEANANGRVFFPANIPIFQYGAAPWAVLFR